MKGYKVFNPDWTCLNMQYEVGKIYVLDTGLEGEMEICKAGFHFCTELLDCFYHYGFDSRNHVAEIEALGDVEASEIDTKYCTNIIKIVRELSWHEVLDLVNTGCGCTGKSNSGDYNTGVCNRGSYNTGDDNNGHHNCGCQNDGYYNTGNHNTGHDNCGDYNCGNANAGSFNSGDYNAGDWNSTNWSTGCFNTEEQKIYFFNKPSNWTRTDWLKSKARRLLRTLTYPTLLTDVTEIGTEVYYFKKEENQRWWDALSQKNKNFILQLPNFDKNIFEEIVGINVEK